MIKPHKFTPKRQSESAFTIVELLIVIVIIAILAAITIVAYNGLQQRARASAASSAVSQAKKKLELYKVDNSTYPATGSLAVAGINDSNDTTYQYTATNNNTNFCLTATTTNVSYYINDTTASSPTAGGCPGHGQGGGVAVTNYVINPSAEGASMNFFVSAGAPGLTLSTDSFPGWPRTGTHSFKVVATSSTETRVRPPNNTVPVGSQSIQSSFYVYNATNSSRDFFVSFQGRTAAGALVGSGRISSAVTIGANSFARVAGTVPTSALSTTFSGAAYIEPMISRDVTNGAAVGDTFYVDDIIATYGDTIYNYADGNSPNWVWNGTANAATSTGPAQ